MLASRNNDQLEASLSYNLESENAYFVRGEGMEEDIVATKTTAHKTTAS